jgi:hypothetical protein
VEQELLVKGTLVAQAIRLHQTLVLVEVGVQVQLVPLVQVPLAGMAGLDYQA